MAGRDHQRGELIRLINDFFNACAPVLHCVLRAPCFDYQYGAQMISRNSARFAKPQSLPVTR